MKLLVASEFAPNAPGGGPAVVRQMLKGWPAQDLTWWSCVPETDRRFGLNVAEHEVMRIPGKLRPFRRFTQAKAWLLETFWAPQAAKHLSKTLAELQPDVAWVIPHDWSIPPLATVLPEGPVGFHVTVQDYVDVHGHTGKFGVERCLRMAADADRLYAAAVTRDATSHPMISDLRKRTGAAATQMLHAGLEEEDFSWLEEKSAADLPEIRIAHAGTILVEEVFALFVEALKRIRKSLRNTIRLDFFGAHSYVSRPWYDREWMIEHGNLPERELIQELRKCTWGFSPMALTDEDPRYNRFSFPTKFITYLAAGLPVLVVGHPESSVVRMASQYTVGMLETGREPEALEAKLREVLSQSSPWEAYRTEILRCTRNEFDAQRMRAKLHTCFAECAASTDHSALRRIPR
ncbi:hypothetical protein ACXR0O_10550 [Verrucomicrobiota bacterium sgz303538]